jgi:long-chain acyl-CoA synthetase
VPKDGAAPSLDEIIDHCRPQIANYKLPRSIALRDTPLPVSGAGKVLKRDLRIPYWGDKERQVN